MTLTATPCEIDMSSVDDLGVYESEPKWGCGRDHVTSARHGWWSSTVIEHVGRQVKVSEGHANVHVKCSLECNISSGVM